MSEDRAMKGSKMGGNTGNPKDTRGSYHSEKVSVAQLQLYLKGIDYPAQKDEIIRTARDHHAPDNIMGFLTRLPERRYQYPTDDEEEFGKMK